MWLLAGVAALVLLLPTALSLDWLLHGIRQKAPPAPAPAGPGPNDPPTLEKGRR
jgi:hypothetical protein